MCANPDHLANVLAATANSIANCLCCALVRAIDNILPLAFDFDFG